MTPEEIEQIQRRLERERRTRAEAEMIAERVTAELYATANELESTNRKLATTNAELQELNRAMRDFVAIASHDLRNPLTSILGFARLLHDGWSRIGDEQRVEFLEAILRQGGHLNNLVDDLLTISSIEAGALDVHQEVIDLRAATERAIADFAGTAADIKIGVPVDITVVVDPEHLYRIMANFMTNAVKYGRPPYIIEAVDDGAWIEIRMKDAGDGVPEEFVPMLFGRFARAENAREMAKGTGLGLSIVQGLAKANGGESWYEPNQPTGSVFGVRLPKNAA